MIYLNIEQPMEGPSLEVSCKGKTKEYRSSVALPYGALSSLGTVFNKREVAFRKNLSYGMLFWPAHVWTRARLAKPFAYCSNLEKKRSECRRIATHHKPGNTMISSTSDVDLSELTGCATMLYPLTSPSLPNCKPAALSRLWVSVILEI